MTWTKKYNWAVPFKRKINIVGYTYIVPLCKHSNGKLICGTSYNSTLLTTDRDLKNSKVLYNFGADFPGFSVSMALLLADESLLVRITNWRGIGHIVKSRNNDYTAFDIVFSDYKGDFMYRSWDTDDKGTVMLAEYRTTEPISDCKIWKSSDYGETWTVIHELQGRQGVNPEIFHFHCVQYDRYSGLWWINAGDTDSESKVFTTDGTTLKLIGTGSQLWRCTSFTFDEDFVYWTTDGQIGAYGYHMRYDRKNGQTYQEQEAPGYSFVTEKLVNPNDQRPLFLSETHTRWEFNKIALSNDGLTWYEVGHWDAQRDVIPFPAWNNFVDNGDGRVYGFVTSIYRHDTKDVFNSGTIIIDIV